MNDTDVLKKAWELIREAKDRAKLARMMLGNSERNLVFNRVSDACEKLEDVESFLSAHYQLLQGGGRWQR